MRTSKALFTVTGSPEELKDIEQLLKGKGAQGIISNEGGRLLQLKWLVVYADYDKKDPEAINTILFAYRATNCKHTSKPNVLSLKVAKSRILTDRYFKMNESGGITLQGKWYLKLFK
jgi:hypothetical protein